MKIPESFGLYLILTDPLAGYAACTRAAVARRVPFLQLRMKERPREEVLEVARELRALTAGTATRLIINDAVDIAAEVDADGVHLGQGDMPLPEARALWGREDRIYGLSTHNLAQVRAAAALAPDYIGIGPVYPTPTKAIADPALGLAGMLAMLEAASVPAVVLGGVNGATLPTVLSAGARNFAVVRPVTTAPDPGAAIEGLLAVYKGGI